MDEAEPTQKYLRIFEKVYHAKHEELWLNNAVPLLLTLARTSSEYKHLFSQARLEEKMLEYDWDYRKAKIADASLAPFSLFGPKSRNQQSLLSQAQKGVVRATQNQYMTQ